MHALVIGATGATGKDLVQQLLADESVERVSVFVRRNLALQHDKLHIHTIDFDRPQHWSQLVKGDILFSCLGTTIKAAGSQEAQWKVDFDYQYQFVDAASANGVPRYILVSSSGADAKSRVFYSRMKGQLEEAVKKLPFEAVTIIQPPILDRKDSDRKGEKMGLKVIQVLNKVGMFRSQRPLSTQELAATMIRAAKENKTGITTWTGEEVRTPEVAG